VPSLRHALDERALAQQIAWLQALGRRFPYSPNAVLADDDPAAVIAHAEKLGYAKRVPHPLGDVITVPDAEIAALNYIRNNALHAYALPALVASLVVSRREVTRTALPNSPKAGCRSCARSSRCATRSTRQSRSRGASSSFSSSSNGRARWAKAPCAPRTATAWSGQVSSSSLDRCGICCAGTT
jgi:hypothetical protein